MTRINLFRRTSIRRRTTPILNSIAWGKSTFENNSGALVFAATLIACSMAVGCSSEKPKTEISTNQSPITQALPPAPISPASAPAAPTMQAPAKPVHKRVVRRVPATVTYADKTSGVSFQYPRKYVLKTGDAANELMSPEPMSMDFVQPGGVALAAVTIPEGAYPKSDLASAFFDVSVNRSLNSEQCGQFSDPQATPDTPVDAAAQPAVRTSTPSKPSKLMIGDMELRSAETLAGVGTGKQTSKYYHVFENGACYEFALKVATTGAETDEGGKHVDRDEVFKRLGRILATVKINPVKVDEVSASVPAAAPANPAQ
jgi:hypothetical protein